MYPPRVQINSAIPHVEADVFLRTLAIAVARNTVGPNDPLQPILAAEGITPQEYVGISQNPTYVRYLEQATKELRESGFSFTAKCRVLAEDLLPTAYGMAKDVETPAVVRAKIIENLVDWAELKPKTNVPIGAGVGFSISISINAPGGDNAPVQTITASSTTSSAPSAADIEDATLVIPSKPDAKAFAYELPFIESDDYEYAGDDVLV